MNEEKKINPQNNNNNNNLGVSTPPKKSNKKNYSNENKNIKTPDWFDKNISKEKISDEEENMIEELLKEYK